MKKFILIIGVVLAGLSTHSNAQYFVTSYGYEVNWGVPGVVHSVVYHDYTDYDWVHANRVVRFGVDYFDIVLRRGDVFIEVSVRNDGYINRRVVHQYYPLQHHVCGTSCGFHSNYYAVYNTGCNSHSHHGHNHVVYNTVHYNKNHGHFKGNGHHGKGNAYGHYKNGKKHFDDDDRRKNNKESYTRRDRYYDSRDSKTRNNRVTYTKTSNGRGR